MAEFLKILKEKPMTKKDLQAYYTKISKTRNKEDYALIANFFDAKLSGGNKERLIDNSLFADFAGKDGILTYDKFIIVKNEDYLSRTKKNFGGINPYNELNLKHLSEELSLDDVFKYRGKLRAEGKIEQRSTIVNEMPIYLIDRNNNIVSDDKEKIRSIEYKSTKKQLDAALEYIKQNDIKFPDKFGKETSLKKVLQEVEDKGYPIKISRNLESKGVFGQEVVVGSRETCTFVDKNDVLYKKGISDDFLLTLTHELMHVHDYTNEVSGKWQRYLQHGEKYNHEQELNQESYAEFGAHSALAHLHQDKEHMEELKNYSELPEDSPYKKYEKEFLSWYE